MAETADVTVQQLFKKWRSGDAEAGKVMAQRFSDWYYAITAVRLGDKRGRGPLARTCEAFAQGIVSVTRSGDLVEWAYGLMQAELQGAGTRGPGVDHASAITGNKLPSRLLREARKGLDSDQIQLLHLVYSGAEKPAEIQRLSESQGGMPVALLRARYTLKRLLRTNASVAFQETPLELNFDRAPLPLYESGGLANAEEEGAFERWMLADPALCRDVAEFAAFAHAMRAGHLISEEPAASPEPSPVTTSPARVKETIGGPSAPTAPAETGAKSGGLPVAVMAGIAFLVVIVGVIVLMLLLKH